MAWQITTACFSCIFGKFASLACFSCILVCSVMYPYRSIEIDLHEYNATARLRAHNSTLLASFPARRKRLNVWRSSAPKLVRRLLPTSWFTPRACNRKRTLFRLHTWLFIFNFCFQAGTALIVERVFFITSSIIWPAAEHR